VAVADLQVEDATVAEAQSAFRAASNRLAPVVWTVKGLDCGVVGAAPLAGKLQDADGILAAESSPARTWCLSTIRTVRPLPATG
jgi:hypothetical protein